MSEIPTTAPERNPAAIMHQLLTAGTVLASYTDMPRMLEFASAALGSIPGVARCTFYRDARQTRDERPIDPIYEVSAETVNSCYGHMELQVRDESLFQPYAAAAHNITGLVAMRMENFFHEQDLQRQIQEKTQELQTSLNERETLLKEIHHRVKNNLNVVESLLKLQFGSIQDADVQKGLEDSVKRIHSMSLLHKLLYQSNTLAGIDFRSFVTQIVAEITATFKSDSHIEIVPDIDDVPVPIEIAVPVILIVNELLTNALKYAFPDTQAGTIHVRAKSVATGTGRIIIEDDGVGLPDDFSVETASSLGMQLVSALTDQINGTLEIQSPPGTRFILTLP